MIQRKIILIITVLFGLVACGKSPETETAVDKAAVEEVQAPVGDSQAGSRLADQCEQCHGRDGNRTVGGSPYIAGQQAGYLVKAMLSYINGEWSHEEKAAILTPLSKTDMDNLAAHYAGQSPNWRQIKKAKKPGGIIVNKKTIALGKRKAGSCFGCHGEKGNSPVEGSPTLAGLPPAYFKSAVLGYFNGDRREKKAMMKTFRHAVSKREINYLAAYFSAQTPRKARYPSHGDAKAGKAFGARACDTCHGINGNSASPDVPSLTGQSADYLVKAINAYKDGLRKHGMMKKAVAKMSKAQIRNVAAYYARQTPKKISVAKSTKDKAFDPVGQGAVLAAACNGCHGKEGNSTQPGMPALSGLHPQYLADVIYSYKNDERKHELMKSFVKGLSDTDIEKLSLYYATREPAAMSSSIKADSKAGESMAAGCNACHGEQGNSNKADTPSIAGQEPAYLVAAMLDYKQDKRQHEGMKNALAELSDEQIKNIAGYFAGLARTGPEVRIPEAPEVLAEKCNRCHGEKGIDANPGMPRLAGQLESYLLDTMNQYANETRKHSAMFAMSAVLSPLERKAIATYYAKQK